MKSKQVAALFLAATLAVTGSGVTTMAGQISAGEATVLEADSELKLAPQKDEKNVSVTVEAGDDKYTYGSEITVTATLSKKSTTELNKEVTHRLEVICADKDAEDFTEAETVPGTVTEGKLDKDGTLKASLTFRPDPLKRYAVRGTTVLKGTVASAQVYNDAELTLAVEKDIKEADFFKKPEFGTIYIATSEVTEGASAKDNAQVKAALKAANDKLDPRVGVWSLSDETTKLKTTDTTLNLKLTSLIYKSASDEEDKGEYEVEVDGLTVKVLPVSVTVKSKTQGVDGTEETLVIDDKNKTPITLEAKITRDSDAVEAAPGEIEWVAPEGSAITVKPNEDGSATVIPNSVTDEKGVVVKAVSKENKEVEGSFTVKVVKGISSDTVKTIFEKYRSQFKDVSYAGNGKLSNYYADLFNKMNQEPTTKDFGSFSFAEDQDVSAADEAGKQVQLRFTAKATDTPIVDAGSWTDGSAAPNYLDDDENKKITLKITKQTIDVAAIKTKLAAVAGSYPLGTSLQDICDVTKLDIPDTAEVTWQKKSDATWSKVDALADEKPAKTGKLSDYALVISVAITQQNNAKLSETNQEDGTYLYEVGGSVEITAPTFKAAVALKDSTFGTNDQKSKYQLGTTAWLTVAKESSLEETILNANYDFTYDWYKKGSSTPLVGTSLSGDNKNVPSSDTPGTLKITDLTADGAGEYYCKVTAKIKGDASDTELKTKFQKFEVTTAPVKVEVTGIAFSDASADIAEAGYGEIADDAVVSVKVTVASDTDTVTAYSMEYCRIDDKNQPLEAKKTAVLVDGNILEKPEQAVLFKEGYTVKALLKNQDLGAGTYGFYVTVKTESGDSDTYGPIKVTVKEKTLDGTAVAAMDGAKLTIKNAEGKDFVYGDSLKDAVISYGWDVSKEDEKALAAALTYEIQDTEKTLAAGDNTVAVTVKAAENYKLETEKTLEATVKVEKAALTAGLSDTGFTMTAGDKDFNLKGKVTVSGLVNGDKEADILTAEAVVLDADGKEVSDLSALAVGDYRVKVKAALTEEGKKNYQEEIAAGDVDVAILTVKAKAEEQKPGTQDPGTDKPGTQDPGTNKPGTQDPGTNTPGTNTPGTNTPGTQDPGTSKPGTEETVTVKKVDITLNGQSLSGTVKAKTKATYNLKAAVTLSNGKKASSVKWKSSNTKIAKVSSKGVVKVQNKTGKVKITATYSDGKLSKSKTITLNVAKANVKAAKLKITGKTSMKAKKSQTLKVTVSPATVTNGKVTWKTSNKKIATVSSKGVVKALKKGKVTITATAKDGSKKKASFKITVK